jgi:hypothetical protein
VLVHEVVAGELRAADLAREELEEDFFIHAHCNYNVMEL